MIQASVAVLIPCLNEENAIGKVITDFHRELPGASIYVYDNASTDKTAEKAREAGAIVRFEGRRGKGFVMERMFRDIEADIYILIDGDDTYPVDRIHDLMAPVLAGHADMVVGSRLEAQKSEFKYINKVGNVFFLRLVNAVFNSNLTDILSGYRVMNRRFVKELPLFSPGFEVETVLTIKALQRRFRIMEVPTPLGKRAEGTVPKIRIIRDGLRILYSILSLARDYKPLTFFGSIAIVSYTISGMALWKMWGKWTLGLEMTVFFVCFLVGLAMTILGIAIHAMDYRFQEIEFLMNQDRPKSFRNHQ